jgi:hypothetical protein
VCVSLSLFSLFFFFLNGVGAGTAEAAAEHWSQLPQHCAVVCSIDLSVVIHCL